MADAATNPTSSERELRAQILEALAESGPLTGSELQQAVRADLFRVWRASAHEPALDSRRIGRRYVRLDRTVDGYARLSPSIQREFLTYTVVGLREDAAALDEAAKRLAARIMVISRTKRRLAERVVGEAFGPLVHQGLADPSQFCALVAGDIVYGMSHNVARREVSTAAVVEGSDLDIIVLVADDADSDLLARLDSAMLSRKWLYLRNPAYREEIDYIIKPMSRLADQAEFDTFQKMVACKVFDEAELIFGNAELHEAGRRLLAERGVLDRLRALELQAASRRVGRQQRLLDLPDGVLPAPEQMTFYTTEEKAEFEH